MTIAPEDNFEGVNKENCIVSFLVCTYNRSQCVESCVRSLLSIQTDIQFEVIVRDNASLDDTQQLLGTIKDSRLTYVRSSKNIGTISFLEIAKLAKGKIITWLSDEDDFEFQHLDFVVNTFRDNPDCSVLIGGVTVGINSTEVKFEEKVVSNISDCYLTTLRFSGCGGVFIRNDTFRKKCSFSYGSQADAYEAWNFYPIGHIATACVDKKLITTSRILVRQVRYAATTNNWSLVENEEVGRHVFHAHYFPEAMFDRLKSSVRLIGMSRNLAFRIKLRIICKLMVGFVAQIDSSLRPEFIKLLSENYAPATVESFVDNMKRKNFHYLLVRKTWAIFNALNLLFTEVLLRPMKGIKKV